MSNLPRKSERRKTPNAKGGERLKGEKKGKAGNASKLDPLSRIMANGNTAVSENTDPANDDENEVTFAKRDVLNYNANISANRQF